MTVGGRGGEYALDVSGAAVSSVVRAWDSAQRRQGPCDIRYGRWAFDPRGIGQRVDYSASMVIALALRDEQARWSSRLAGAAQETLKRAVVIWYGARGLDRATFRGLLMDPYVSDETVDELRQAARGIVEARTHEAPGAAGSDLARAALETGLDLWPRVIGDAERRGHGGRFARCHSGRDEGERRRDGHGEGCNPCDRWWPYRVVAWPSVASPET